MAAVIGLGRVPYLGRGDRKPHRQTDFNIWSSITGREGAQDPGQLVEWAAFERRVALGSGADRTVYLG